MTMKKVGILYHPLKEDAVVLARKLENVLGDRGILTWVSSAWEWQDARSSAAGTDLILTVGGDGTILRSAQVAIATGAPITGVNLGRLGFMTELTTDEVMEMLPALLNEGGWIDERCLIEAELSPAGIDAEPADRFCALNDVVVARGAAVRLISVEVSINGACLTTYRADGVITATATGSTSYSLAAGGPILHPRAEDFLLVPIVPHLASAYPLVLPPGSVVSLCLTGTNPAMLSIDGHINMPVPIGATVTVRRSARTVRFLRIHPEISFYGTLEKRLKGKLSN